MKVTNPHRRSVQDHIKGILWKSEESRDIDDVSDDEIERYRAASFLVKDKPAKEKKPKTHKPKPEGGDD